MTGVQTCALPICRRESNGKPIPGSLVRSARQRLRCFGQVRLRFAIGGTAREHPCSPVPIRGRWISCPSNTELDPDGRTHRGALSCHSPNSHRSAVSSAALPFSCPSSFSRCRCCKARATSGIIHNERTRLVQDLTPQSCGLVASYWGKL